MACVLKELFNLPTKGLSGLLPFALVPLGEDDPLARVIAITLSISARNIGFSIGFSGTLKYIQLFMLILIAIYTLRFIVYLTTYFQHARRGLQIET